MVKYIPNALCFTRLFLCIPLLFFIEPFSPWFMALYIVAGITDMIDGTIARMTNSQSEFGATLDSIADLVFVLVMLFVLAPVISLGFWEFVWIGIVLVLKAVSIVIAYIKYREFVMTHTYLNKGFILMLFAFPLLYSVSLVPVSASIAVLATVLIIATLEEIIINITSEEPARNAKGLFFKSR